MRMTADELLRRYPRETLRWLRRRLGLTQLALSLELDAYDGAVGHWESRKQGISPAYRTRLAALLAPHLAMPEGQAFAPALGEEE
jgi:hypothetical protein